MWKVIFISSIFFIGCRKENNYPIPDLLISTNEFVEGDSPNEIEIKVILTNAYDRSLIFNYRTADADAVVGIDYTQADGSVEIQAGELEGNIILELLGDDHLELTESFTLIFIIEGVYQVHEIIIKDDDFFSIGRNEQGTITPLEYPSMKLIWNDEFDGEKLNEENWEYNIGDGCDLGICGWGNDELESYTDLPDNLKTNDGKLIIMALKDPSFTSARITTKGKQEFTFGRIDIRAKLPFGQGIWPALWMLGSNIDDVGWPDCGEIDIMELVGHEPSTVHGTAHYNANGHAFKGGKIEILDVENLFNQFHVYSIIWERNSIKWYVDYQEYFVLNREMVGETYPFNNMFYFLFNVAIGGRWPGNPDESTNFPQLMIVDYIRVFR